jgi:hypothetical protein
LEGLAVGGGEVGLLDVSDEEFAVEAIGLTAAAADHEGGIRARGDADEDALIGAVRLLDAQAAKVVFELVIDDLGGEKEGEFAEFGELLLEGGGLRGGERPAVESAGEAVLRGRVHDLDVVGAKEEGAGDGNADPASADGLDARLKLPNVLDVDRRDDGDAGGEEYFDVLPAVRVGATWGIGVGQGIDQADGGAALADGGEIQAGLAEVEALGDGLKLIDEGLDFFGRIEGRGADDDVFAASLAAAALVEHAVAFADA